MANRVLLKTIKSLTKNKVLFWQKLENSPEVQGELIALFPLLANNIDIKNSYYAILNNISIVLCCSAVREYSLYKINNSDSLEISGKHYKNELDSLLIEIKGGV